MCIRVATRKKSIDNPNESSESVDGLVPRGPPEIKKGVLNNNERESWFDFYKKMDRDFGICFAISCMEMDMYWHIGRELLDLLFLLFAHIDDFLYFVSIEEICLRVVFGGSLKGGMLAVVEVGSSGRGLGGGYGGLWLVEVVICMKKERLTSEERERDVADIKYKDKNNGKTDKTEHGDGKSARNRSRRRIHP
ncbi:hypothetical protein Tco_0252706 [Tanacetum coccineum]